ncbi:Protein CBG25169 [Caenorhabditis briggsae]|uniref:Protein CBG25169 n=1 Tax=Caenorhabditis briggsae TaxID=6238 RepID=B6IKX5_CAEBR|nr:Protein CBG25169 [Caenorhabditis briggsae]CAS00555.1 Protein CBG25169 [Caenorhabditis briggsae]
MDSDSMLP